MLQKQDTILMARTVWLKIFTVRPFMKKFVLTIYCPNTLGMVLYETVDGASLVYFTGLF